jgi:hypothetical protein
MRRSPLIAALLVLFSYVSMAQINLGNGLIAYYPFNGNANDASGNNNHGVVNGATLTTDRFGNLNSAFSFDGLDDLIQVPDAASLNPTGAMSVALYFNASQNGVQTLIGKIGFSQGVATQFQVAMDFALFPGVLFGVNPISNGCLGVPLNAAYANTGGPLQTNRWYCVVGTFDNGTINIYLDGLLIQTVNAGFTQLNRCANADIQIGSWWAGDPQRFRGKIDDIRIYDRALNVQEVQALCSQQVIGTPLSGVINAYAEVLGLDVCNNTLTVDDASAFNTGDTVLMAQMKGAVIDVTNSASFGNIQNMRNAGNYEINYVAGKNGNSLMLRNNIQRTYDIPDGRVQLVRIPYYTNATVIADVVSIPWNGRKGGIVALHVRDTLNLNANIDVSGQGFIGGQAANPNQNVTFCNETG